MPSSRRCRRSLLIPLHGFGRSSVIFHLPTLEIDAPLADFADESAGVGDEQKRAAVFDQGIEEPRIRRTA